MPDFGIFRGFNSKLFSDKLFAGQLPTQLGKIGSENFGYLFLLDDYPNAAASYSLRKLRSAYTGSAIRVRRSSDNTEQDIGFVSNVLDTSSLISFCGSGNGFVTTWYDQSGNAKNAIQTTAANQPQIISNGSIILDNGKPAINFNLDTTKKWQLVSSNVSFTTSISFVSIFNSTFNNEYMKVWSAGNDLPVTGYAFNSMSKQDASDWKLKDAGFFGNGYESTSNPRIISNGQVFFDNTQYLAYGELNSSFSRLYKNNAEITYRKQTVGNTDNQSLPIYISGGTFGTQGVGGKIQELIIYTSSQSSNRTGISSNINTYYGIY